MNSLLLIFGLPFFLTLPGPFKLVLIVMGGFATLGVQKEVEVIEMEGANLQGIHEAAAPEGVAQHIFCD